MQVNDMSWKLTQMPHLLTIFRGSTTHPPHSRGKGRAQEALPSWWGDVPNENQGAVPCRGSQGLLSRITLAANGFNRLFTTFGNLHFDFCDWTSASELYLILLCALISNNSTPVMKANRTKTASPATVEDSRDVLPSRALQFRDWWDHVCPRAHLGQGCEQSETCYKINVSSQVPQCTCALRWRWESITGGSGRSFERWQ